MNNKVKFNVEDEINTLPEVEPEVQTDSEESEEVVTSDTLEQFYAADPRYDELRDAMQDTEFRLFLINNDLVIPGSLKGNDIQFLDLVGEEENEEFVLKDAPTKLEEILEYRTVYNKENCELVDKEEITEVPHEKIVEYILNLKIDKEDTEDIEDDEVEIDKMEKEETEDENTE